MDRLQCRTRTGPPEVGSSIPWSSNHWSWRFKGIRTVRSSVQSGGKVHTCTIEGFST
ncbi:hypothetical protein ANCCAN_29422 [Ancylostoma caninum]|uniref:Uncharacterized protein n=1 Tax=Ancylostoma caninum TaxID=29170 RepID=A0A368EYJ1_ANCCA|nr:hypothetical protein ANCCAN_29422 [Ancylostoma caninum]